MGRRPATIFARSAAGNLLRWLTRSGAVLARHAGIDEKTGQLSADEDGGLRQLVVTSDFYAVYQSAGKKADGLVNLFCWAHLRRHFVRAGAGNRSRARTWNASCPGAPAPATSAPGHSRPGRPANPARGNHHDVGHAYEVTPTIAMPVQGPDELEQLELTLWV